MAMTAAKGVADNSAHRATNRALEMLNSRMEQLLVLKFLENKKCSYPADMGGYILYLIPAMRCHTEILKGNTDSEKCRQEKWKALDTSSE